MLNPDGTKRCPRCEQNLQTSQFYKINRATGDGWAGFCKSCTKRSATDWQKKHPEKMLAKWQADSARFVQQNQLGLIPESVKIQRNKASNLQS